MDIITIITVACSLLTIGFGSWTIVNSIQVQKLTSQRKKEASQNYELQNIAEWYDKAKFALKGLRLYHITMNEKWRGIYSGQYIEDLKSMSVSIDNGRRLFPNLKIKGDTLINDESKRTSMQGYKRLPIDLLIAYYNLTVNPDANVLYSSGNKDFLSQFPEIANMEKRPPFESLLDTIEGYFDDIMEEFLVQEDRTERIKKNANIDLDKIKSIANSTYIKEPWLTETIIAKQYGLQGEKVETFKNRVDQMVRECEENQEHQNEVHNNGILTEIKDKLNIPLFKIENECKMHKEFLMKKGFNNLTKRVIFKEAFF